MRTIARMFLWVPAVGAPAATTIAVCGRFGGHPGAGDSDRPFVGGQFATA